MNSKDEKLDLKAKKEVEKGPWSSLVLGRPSDRASAAEDGDKIQSKSLAESDPIYIESINGPDEGGRIEISSDDDTWQYPNQPLVGRFDAPAPDRATSPSSA